MKRNLMLFLLMLFLTSSAFAMEIQGSVLEQEVSPGDHIKLVTTLHKTENEKPQDFYVDIKGFGEDIDGRFIDLSSDEDISPHSARTLLTFTPSTFHMEPNDTQEVVFEGDIPSDIESGGRYALATITTGKPESVENESTEKEAKVSVRGILLIPIILVIEGPELARTGEINDIEIDQPILPETQELNLTLKNTGNFHYKALIKADLKDESGNVISSSSTPLSDSSIIPTFSRGFHLTFMPDSPLETGTYFIDANASLEDGTILASKNTSFDVAA